MAAPLLEMSGIGKTFPGVVALQDVSLTLREGEVMALLGENGAGKSTLINILSGVFSDYDGTVRVQGEPVRLTSPSVAQGLGIATIHQELNLVGEMSVADNIFLGRELGAAGFVNKSGAQSEAKKYLTQVGLQISPRTLIRQLRVAEQQLVEVAKALSLDARVLIMDEPTSALADAEVRKLFEVIRRLTADGVGIIYVSHRLEELEEIADSVTVLRDGRWIGAKPMEGTTRPELIRMMVGRDVQDLPRRVADVETKDAPRLRVSNLSVASDPAAGRVPVVDVSFDVRPGEIVGLAGLMGAGRTETLEAIYGNYPRGAVGGQIEFDGKPYVPTSPKAAIRQGFALVAEDRKQQSLVLPLSVRFNASLASLGRFIRAGFVRSGAEREAVAEQVKALGVKTPSVNTAVGTLSGGNQQKVVLAKCLLTNPSVILLDEPTRGIDVGAKSEIYELVAELADQGTAIVVASSELPELLRMCDRIVVLCEGRRTAEFNADKTTQEEILAAAMARSTVTDDAATQPEEVPAP